MSRRRRRLDVVLVDRGLAASRTAAQDLIVAGRVTVGGAPAGKAATLVAADAAVVVAEEGQRWASRGGAKLDGAIARLGVDVAGCRVLDAGAAHGGFTDVLLARGAATVVAVDVGYGQLPWRLATDPRVQVLDRTNVRHLTAESVGAPVDLIVADLSFISLTLVLPALWSVATPQGEGVLLVKPQFEAGRDAVGRDGVVRDPAVWRAALERVVGAAAACGLALVAAVPSPLRGPAGNVEFFVQLRPTAGAPTVAPPSPSPATVPDPATLLTRVVQEVTPRRA